MQTNRPRQVFRPAYLLLPTAFLPLFIGLPSLSVPILHLVGVTVVRDSLNIAASLSICLLGIWAWWTGYTTRSINRHIWFCLVWLGLSLLVGLFFEPAKANLLFYIQTLLPIFALAYGRMLVRSPEDIDRFIGITSATGGVFVAVLIVTVVANYGISSLLNDRMSVMKDIAYAIPQFKSYYPVTVLASFSFTLARYLFNDRASSATSIWLGLHAAFIPLCWSRAGMLGFGLCAAIMAGIAATRGGASSKQRVVLATLLCAAVLPFASSKLGSTFSARTEVHDVGNDSDQKRLNLFLEGCQRVAASPVFGDMFIPVLEKEFMGEDVEIKRLFAAHHQYVDLMLRGGIAYLLVFCYFLWRVLRQTYAVTKSSAADRDTRYLAAAAGSLGFLIPTAVGANFQLYFVQLQTATPFYMVLGFALGVAYLSAERPRSNQRPARKAEASTRRGPRHRSASKRPVARPSVAAN